MPNKTIDSGIDIDRRRVLKSTAIATGAGLVGVSGFTGAAGARGNKGGGKVECGCGSLLAKYEWDGDSASFVFEKGRESLGINGDEFDISVTETNEDGEPLAFDFASPEYGANPRLDKDTIRPYEASCLTVKAGQGVDTKDFEGYVSEGSYRVPDKYAISNIQFCIQNAFWQIDMGVGDAPDWETESWDTAEVYNVPGEIMLMSGQTVGDDPSNIADEFLADHRLGGFAFKSPAVTYNRNTDGLATSATVQFKLNQTERLHLGSWETPGPWSVHDVPWSKKYDYVEKEFGPGDHTITVNLPTL